jgi:protein gp37
MFNGGGLEMNKTKIEWCDYTWNPVSGCLHNCSYCYARKIANRFRDRDFDQYEKYHVDDCTFTLETPQARFLKDSFESAYSPYPYCFRPTFHKYRLNEPTQLKNPAKIFVCSMADLFGEWVPDEWIEEVFNACEAAPQHKYMFLTKNPKRYLSLYDKKIFPYKEKFWFGTTLTKPSDEYVWFEKTPYKTFISIEPLLEGFGELEKGVMPNWVIIGQQTGPGAVPPKPEWVQNIIDQCRTANVPVFVKSPLYEKFPIQEWPEGLR